MPLAIAVYHLHDIDFTAARPTPAILTEGGTQHPKRGPDTVGGAPSMARHPNPGFDPHLTSWSGYKVGPAGLDTGRKPTVRLLGRGDSKPVVGLINKVIRRSHRLNFIGTPISGTAGVLSTSINDPVVIESSVIREGLLPCDTP